MLQLCPFLLQSVVVLLQHSDQLLVVVYLLSVQELDLLRIDTVVLRHIGHLPECPVLSQRTLQLIGLLVDLLQQFHHFLVLGILLHAQLVELVHVLAHLHVSRIELQVLGQCHDLVLLRLLSLLVGQLPLVENLDSLEEQLVLLAEALQLLTFLLQGKVYLGLDDLLNTVD